MVVYFSSFSYFVFFFFFSSRRRHTRSVSAFLLNRSSDLCVSKNVSVSCVYAQETLTFLLTQKKTCVKNYVQKRSEERRVGKECRSGWSPDHKKKKKKKMRRKTIRQIRDVEERKDRRRKHV